MTWRAFQLLLYQIGVGISEGVQTGIRHKFCKSDKKILDWPDMLSRAAGHASGRDGVARGT